jgi:hypothetical protein
MSAVAAGGEDGRGLDFGLVHAGSRLCPAPGRLLLRAPGRVVHVARIRHHASRLRPGRQHGQPRRRLRQRPGRELHVHHQDRARKTTHLEETRDRGQKPTNRSRPPGGSPRLASRQPQSTTFSRSVTGGGWCDGYERPEGSCGPGRQVFRRRRASAAGPRPSVALRPRRRSFERRPPTERVEGRFSERPDLQV